MSLPASKQTAGVQQPLIERQAVRAIILTPEREILLLRIKPQDCKERFWITPGGGIEPGESIEAALRRELWEELGLERFVMGPLVWRRQHTFDWAHKRILQREQYHIVQISRFEPRMSDDHEMQIVDEFRWWPIDALASSAERLTPLSLAAIVDRYLFEGPPQEMPPVEILVD